LQFLISPAGDDWRGTGISEVHSLIGKQAPKPSPFAFLGNFFGSFASEISKQIRGPIEVSEAAAGDFSGLTTGEQVVVEEIQKNITRMAFLTKFRVLYAAPIGQLQTGRVMSAIVGAIKQFNTLDVNAFVGGTNTSASGWFGKDKKEKRAKQEFLQACKDRSMGVGDAPYHMSTVELATVYHFPVETVRAPLLSRTATKKSEPPTSLPFDASSFGSRRPGSVLDTSAQVVGAGGASNRPRPIVIPRSGSLQSGFQAALPARIVVPTAAPYQTTPPPAALSAPSTPPPSQRPATPPAAPPPSPAGTPTNLPVG
jgi:hypothetical protein